MPYVDFYKEEYGAYIHNGVLYAYDLHIKNGGKKASFIILSLIETASDTDGDAMNCAAVSATWQALGHSEKDISFIYNEAWDAVINPG